MSDTDKKEKVTMYLDPEILKTLRHEAVERRVALGALVEEAVRSRVTALWKTEPGAR